MGSRAVRARSSTSTLPLSRPLSAHSAQSTDSNATQPMPTGSSMPHQISQNQQHAMISPTWPAGMHHPNQPQMANDVSMGAIEAQIMGFSHQNPLPFAQANFTYNRIQSPTVSSVEGETATAAVAASNGEGEAEVPKKKGSATSIANDMELRRLFRTNEGRGLEDVAQEVKKEEKGPRAEKSKQVFGMLWLSQNIKKSTGSVPRNRVYTSYANRCADDNLPLLNPASFGKLVRIIFPNVSTRRLGVRGESKYHYVDLSLVNDDGRGSVPPTSGSGGKVEAPKARPLSLQPRLLGMPTKSTLSPKIMRPQVSAGHKRASSIFLQESVDPNMATSSAKRSRTMARSYQWPVSNEPPSDAPMELPDIEPFLPPGADSDAAKNLHAVYLSHCRLAIDKFRYCHTDAFCESFKSLIGLLTVPSQKLISSHHLAAWIEACDTLKYQRMTPLLRHILLAVLPPVAMSHMERVANNLCTWIRQYFGNQPQHLLDAMIRPAKAFSKLILRFIRVNRSASDVSKVFDSQQTRDELWLDWMKGSDAGSIVEEACDPVLGGHHRLLYMLFQESRFLLQPSNEALECSKGTMFDELAWTNLHPPAAMAFKTREEELEKENNRAMLVERLQRFVEDIPSRYPGIEAEEILSYVSRITGTATRNMTMNQTGNGLQNWWTISIFISEMMYWMAEVGGFLSRDTTAPAPADAYLSPYENSSHAVNSQGASNGSVVGQVAARQSPITQKKLAHLESTFSIGSGTVRNDSAHDGNQRARISLGGETVVGDDEDYSQLGDNIDWSTMDIKDPGIFTESTHVVGAQNFNVAH